MSLTDFGGARVPKCALVVLCRHNFTNASHFGGRRMPKCVTVANLNHTVANAIDFGRPRVPKWIINCCISKAK